MLDVFSQSLCCHSLARAKPLSGYYTGITWQNFNYLYLIHRLLLLLFVLRKSIFSRLWLFCFLSLLNVTDCMLVRRFHPWLFVRSLASWRKMQEFPMSNALKEFIIGEQAFSDLCARKRTKTKIGVAIYGFRTGMFFRTPKHSRVTAQMLMKFVAFLIPKSSVFA